MITPFTFTGAVDIEALKELLEFQIKSGIDGLVSCGTTGESSTLSHEEHVRVIALTVKHVNGRVPVTAGTGSNSTDEAIRLSQQAEEAGADALLLVNPYYVKPTQKGLYLHFKAVARAVSIPCILYNIQSRTGVNLETETLLRLANEVDNIVGVKEASGSLKQGKEVLAGRPRSFRVLSGDDSITLDLMEEGGDGVISVAANIVPFEMGQMAELALKGKMDKARELEERLKPLFEAFFVETNPIPIKTALAMHGWCEEVFRLPMCSFSDEKHYELIRSALRGFNVSGR